MGQKKPKQLVDQQQRGNSAESVSVDSPAEFAAPPPPPIVISPQEVDHISITLEKNQQCACKDCGKLFNSVWYLKQHAVKHSNDRPFKCRFCMKTYKFRSNLYQHKCPERNRLLMAGEFSLVGHPYRRRPYNRSSQKSNTNNCAGNSAVASSAPITINTSATNGGIYSPATFGSVEAANGGGGSGLLMVDGAQNEQKMEYRDEIAQQQQQQLNGVGESYAAPGPFASVNGHSPANNNASSSATFDPQFQHQNGGDKSNSSNSTSSSSTTIAKSSARERELPAELIEEYMRRNRHRVFNCRKCKLYFPSREYFDRHIAYHNELEEYKYCCERCPERFQSESVLQSHQLQHAEQSPHCCLNCSGVFRSALALRRHKDNWRQCHSPIFGSQFSLAVNPIDQYSFVECNWEELESERSDVEEERADRSGVGEEDWGTEEGEYEVAMSNGNTRKTTRDSGYQGSDTYSPPEATGSHSPTTAENDQLTYRLLANGQKRDDQGRFVLMKGMSNISNGGTTTVAEQPMNGGNKLPPYPLVRNANPPKRSGQQCSPKMSWDKNNNQKQKQQQQQQRMLLD